MLISPTTITPLLPSPCMPSQWASDKDDVKSLEDFPGSTARTAWRRDDLLSPSQGHRQSLMSAYQSSLNTYSSMDEVEMLMRRSFLPHDIHIEDANQGHSFTDIDEGADGHILDGSEEQDLIIQDLRNTMRIFRAQETSAADTPESEKEGDRNTELPSRPVSLRRSRPHSTGSSSRGTRYDCEETSDTETQRSSLLATPNSIRTASLRAVPSPKREADMFKAYQMLGMEHPYFKHVPSFQPKRRLFF